MVVAAGIELATKRRAEEKRRAVKLARCLTFAKTAAPDLHPRFIRQLSPDLERLVLPDPVTGRWPRLDPDAVAEPTRGRRAVAWSDRPPARTAYAGWLRDSAPIGEPASAPPAGANWAEGMNTRAASVDEVELERAEAAQ
jgi:hypothetical protein